MSSLLSFDRCAATVCGSMAQVHTHAVANNRNTLRMASRASVELTPESVQPATATLEAGRPVGTGIRCRATQRRRAVRRAASLVRPQHVVGAENEVIGRMAGVTLRVPVGQVVAMQRVRQLADWARGGRERIFRASLTWGGRGSSPRPTDYESLFGARTTRRNISYQRIKSPARHCIWPLPVRSRYAFGTATNRPRSPG
jgi:hypothetical protein